MSLPRKCVRLVGWCDAMSRALAPLANGERKGLSTVVGLVDGHPRPMLLGVVYREKARARGTMLNVCPWCESSLRWWPEDQPAAGEGAQ